MAIDPRTGLTTDGAANYEDTLAVNSSGPSAVDGTEYVALVVNNYMFGRQQALITYAGLTPTGVAESNTVSQELEALKKGLVTGPGLYVPWPFADSPSTAGYRVILLTGQGILRASYPLLDAAVYVGDTANPTAEYFYHADDAAGTTRNTSGIYLILPESRDYVLPNGPRVTSAFWHTVNGYGSSSTKIQKFTTEVDASNDVVVTVVNSATLGFTITANIDCTIYVNYNACFNGSAEVGISKNSSELTTNIVSITASDRLSVISTESNNHPNIASWAGQIASSDILRPHTSGGSDPTSTSLSSISVLAVESPRTTGTIQGITY